MNKLPVEAAASISQQARVLQSMTELTIRKPNPAVAWKMLRDWIDLLLKAVPATALLSGFMLVLVYAVMERRFPRITADATFALIALSSVGLLSVLLLSIVFIVPSRLASGASPKGSWQGQADVFLLLFVFCGTSLGLWHGGYLVLRWLEQPVGMERIVLNLVARGDAAGYGYFIHTWLFPWIYTFATALCSAAAMYAMGGWLFAPNHAGPSRAGVVIWRSLLLLVVGGAATSGFMSYVCIAQSFWYIVLLMAFAVGTTIVASVAKLLLGAVNRKRASPLEIYPGPLTAAGVFFVSTVVLVVELIGERWSVIVPVLYFLIAFASAWFQAPLQTPKAVGSQIIHAALVGIMFCILSPVIAPACMNVLGFGNRTARQITVRTSDYEEMWLETRNLPKPDVTRPYTALKNVHVVYDLGGEVVIRIHDDKGVPLLWPIPREKVVGIVWSSLK